MTPFPFSAIVGQDEMKTAMILTAVDPRIGGAGKGSVIGNTASQSCVRGLDAHC